MILKIYIINAINIKHDQNSNIKLGISLKNSLNKYKITINKKNYTQRFQWFETKILSYYRNLNYSKILIIGDNNFIIAFKNSAKKAKWNINLTFSLIPEISLVNNSDLIIDTIYQSKYFKNIYGKRNVSSLGNVYLEILIKEAISFFKRSGALFYYFVVPYIKGIKYLDIIDKRYLNGSFLPKKKGKKEGFNN